MRRETNHTHLSHTSWTIQTPFQSTLITYYLNPSSLHDIKVLESSKKRKRPNDEGKGDDDDDGESGGLKLDQKVEVRDTYHPLDNSSHIPNTDSEDTANPPLTDPLNTHSQHTLSTHPLNQFSRRDSAVERNITQG